MATRTVQICSAVSESASRGLDHFRSSYFCGSESPAFATERNKWPVAVIVNTSLAPIRTI